MPTPSTKPKSKPSYPKSTLISSKNTTISFSQTINNDFKTIKPKLLKTINIKFKLKSIKSKKISTPIYLPTFSISKTYNNKSTPSKKPQKYHTKTLTPQQQHQLIETTVNEIFTSQKLLHQIKDKLKPKVEQRVRFILIRDLEKQLTKCQNQIQDKIAQERQEFKQKRKIHWEHQAENQLKQLAIEFEQLKEKKTSMEQIVKQKITQRQNVMRKYKEAVEKFKQAKELEKNIKQLQQKLTKGDKGRANSKSIDKRINKKN